MIKYFYFTLSFKVFSPSRLLVLIKAVESSLLVFNNIKSAGNVSSFFINNKSPTIISFHYKCYY